LMSDDRQRTATSSFGVSRREGHDSSAFYARFTPPILSDDDLINQAPDLGDGCLVGDSRDMHQLPDACVALVVTSPPYFVGKEYEDSIAATGDSRIPNSYFEYLSMLESVFAECVRVLEPGGRFAINVANLGRKPYRSLSADVIRILEDLGLLLRGEIIWQKSKGSSGSCAWGSFRSAANPSLRDTTERIIIASKGRFDRAKSPAERLKLGLPNSSTLPTDEFMEATLDVWDMHAESARRVQHPAPFPVELPRRLIDLYTFEGDVVLDPFMGSGTTLVASVLTDRRGIGYDLDSNYVDVARNRVMTARARAWAHRQPAGQQPPFPEIAEALSAVTDEEIAADSFQRQATREGKKAQDIAMGVIENCGFVMLQKNAKVPRAGVQYNFKVEDEAGGEWWIDVSGAFTTVRPGLLRIDTIWKTLGRASVLKAYDPAAKILILTSHLPRSGSEGDKAMRAVSPFTIFDAIPMFDDEAQERLRSYAAGGATVPLPGFWKSTEIVNGMA
ncbi:MAG: site-specific DNA-methyltransferase, partial [Actinomycetota bacterium]|nr:site-specific DNA-methyltransferase [Actinomycetota bacterium]